jgi:DNA-binding MarR family transcriptional regulator
VFATDVNGANERNGVQRQLVAKQALPEKRNRGRGTRQALPSGEKNPKERFLTTRLGFDRTVVHRSIKAMVEEGLASETKAKTGRALLVKLTAKGNKYRENLIRERRAAEEKLRKELTDEETATLIRLLKVMAELEI